MTVPFDTFNRAAGALGTSSSGHLWTLRDTGPYDNAGNPIAQEPSIITLNGFGQAIGDPTQQLTKLQFATLDHGTGDSPAEGWEVGYIGDPPSGTGMGLVFRWTAPTQYWNAFWYKTGGVGSDGLVFLERQNGSTFAAASPRVDAVANNTLATNVLRVIATGSSINVYFNEVLKISMTNASFASSPHHGISFFHHSGMDWFGRGGTLWTVGRGRIGDRSGLWH